MPATERRPDAADDLGHLLRALTRPWPGSLPRPSDLLVTVTMGFCALIFLDLVPSTNTVPTQLVAAVAALAFSLPFLWRRSHPVVTAWVVVGAHILHLVLVHEPTPAVVAAPLAMYGVGRWGPTPRVRRVFVVVAAVGSLAAGVSWSGMGSGGPSLLDVLPVTVAFAFVCFGGALSSWLLGALLRQRDASREEVRRRAAAVEQGRMQNIRLAEQEERARIAREMHDVVAHSLSVVVVQSDGAAYALDRAVESGDPDAMASAIRSAATALATIGATARESLADTRRLVAVLRQDDAEVAYAPTAGVAAIGDLVEPLRAAGLEIHVDVAGTRRPLTRAADLAAYRVVQESLTNVIKHAGSATVWVSLDHLDSALLVTVRDNGAGITTAPDGAGHGLIGMRERVMAVGGALWAGPAPGGGFVVEARIPYDAQGPADVVPAPRDVGGHA